jgi:hypothetical protein
MICGYTTFELERVPVRERWDRVRARAVASRRDARDDTIARRTTLVPTVRKRARAWLAKLGSRGGDRRRRVGAVGENDARVSSEARVRARLSKRTVMVPHRYPAKTLPTRSDTDSPAPRSSSMRALDASAALATRARSIAAPTPCPPRREARRPGRYAPRRRRRAERSARDLGRCAKKRTKKSDEETWMRVFEFGMAVGRLSRARSGGFSTCFQKRNCRTVFFSIFTLHVRWSNKDPRGLFGNAYVSNTTPQFVTT